MTDAGFHHVVVSEIFIDCFGFCRGLNYYESFTHIYLYLIKTSESKLCRKPGAIQRVITCVADGDPPALSLFTLSVQKANWLINDTFYNLLSESLTKRKASFTPGTRNAHTVPDKI